MLVQDDAKLIPQYFLLIKSICGVFYTLAVSTQRFNYHYCHFKKRFMRKLSGLFFAFFLFSSCKKEDLPQKECDMQKVFADNAAKVTISNGIWGTVSSMEGNCMPMIALSNSSCTHCPVNRTVKIYEYTLQNQALPSGNSGVFFDNFNTQLLAQAEADSYGFFQINVPPGKYTIAVVENGKLYANGLDGQGGLNPVSFSGGKLNANVVMTHKAVF
jgi:hypothetical protein